MIYRWRETADGVEPLDRSLCYSSIGFDSSAAIMDDIISTPDGQDIQVEQFMPELGPGQQELSVGHEEPRRAADNVVHVRETLRGAARQRCVLASFASK